MGWWTQSKEGKSFAEGSTLLWGDEPADAIDAAIKKIERAFIRQQGRVPSADELRAGLEFSLGAYEDEEVI